MSTNLTEQEFSKHVGTEFKIALGEGAINLTLAEVKTYTPDPNEQSGLARFSVFFDGPADLMLPQQTHQLQHGKMGELYLFLVPISGDRNGFRYEAVFNYYKTE